MAILTGEFAIGWVNHASGKTMASSTAATGYPVSNLNNSRLSQQFRTTALSTQNIDVDLAAARDIDVIALIGNNFTDTATAATRTSESAAYSSPEFNQLSTLIYDATTYPALISDTPRYGRNMIVLPGTTYNSRYVRTTVTNAGNPDSRLSARVYWVGPLWQPGTGFTIEQGSFRKKRETVGSPGMERYITVLEVDFALLTEGEARALESLCSARLRTGRLLVIPRPLQPATWLSEALYCTLVGLPTLNAWPQGGGLIYWTVSLVFRECED
jgi:hypothetical protein